MDKVYGTEAARLIGVSRSTVLRMDKRNEMPADGTDPDGSRFWLRSTIYSYMSRGRQDGVVVFVRSSVVPGLEVPDRKIEATIRGSAHPLDITATSPATALVELLSLISESRATVLCIGASFASTPLFVMLAAFAKETNVSILLQPDV